MPSLKREFTRHGRPGAYSKDSFSQQDPVAVPEGNGANEHTPLLDGDQTILSNVTTRLSGRNPHALLDDGRPYVRWPAIVTIKTWEVLSSNYVNILLVFVPVGIILGEIEADPTAVFIINFLAIIPLAALLSFATEEISVKLGQTLGGLLNATFGNAVELIVSIIALRDNQIRIVQASMLGSILSNMLLVLGCCFIAGGYNRQEQTFNKTVASTLSSLMAVASASLIIPATLYAALARSKASSDDNILILSHGTAVILLLLYILYLFFQLKTHASLFDQESGANDGEAEEPILGPWAAAVVLVIVTILVSLCADYLVGSISSIVERTGVSKTFIGLILIPIVGNAAEHVTACVVAYKNKMDLAIGVAIGSSLQIALFVTPFLVLLGWAMDRAMTLHFQMFETVVFFLSVLVVNYLIADGSSNYLEGCMCLGTYTIIALAFYIYPDDAGDPIMNLFGGK